MIREVLSHYHLPMLSSAGLLLFFGLFAAWVIWVFRRGRADIYRAVSELPFNEPSQPKSAMRRSVP